MAKLVAAFGSSHSIMLVCQRFDWQHGFAEVDPKNPHYYDRAGNHVSYQDLLASAPADSSARVTPDIMGARYVDRFSRRDGRWKIDERTVVLDWHKVETWPAADAPIAVNRFVQGVRDQTDPVYVMKKHRTLR